MQNIFETSIVLSEDGGVICKFSKNLTGDADGGDDIYLGVDGGVFIFAEGEDMGTDKKYEFFPKKVDFSEFGMPINDDGTDDGQQENKNVGNTDSIALEDQYLESDENDNLESKSKEPDLNSQETGPDQIDTEKDAKIPSMTDSIALDEYQESMGNENHASQDTGIGQTSDMGMINKDHDSNSKDPDMNSQETGPDQIDTEKHAKIPSMTDSIALDDEYQHIIGNENDIASQNSGIGQTSDVEVIDEDHDSNSKEPDMNSQEIGPDQIDAEKDAKIPSMTDSIALDNEYKEITGNENYITSQDTGIGQTSDVDVVDEDHDSNSKEPDMNSQDTRPDQTDRENDDKTPALTDSTALDDEYQENTGNEHDTISQDTGIGQTSDVDVVDEDHDSNSKEPDMNSQDTRPDQTNTENDDKTPALTDSIALDDEYQEIKGNESDTSQDIGIGQTSDIDVVDEDHDSNSKEPHMNSQETEPDQTDTENDDKTPPMTDSIALDDEYQENTGNENDTSQGTGQGLTGEIDDEYQTQEEGLIHNEDPGPVGEYGLPGEPEIGQEGVPFQCDGNTDGFRFLHLPKTFTKFTECHDGVFHERDCPRGALFFVTLQCCINYAKFPCRRNCAN